MSGIRLYVNQADFVIGAIEYSDYLYIHAQITIRYLTKQGLL